MLGHSFVILAFNQSGKTVCRRPRSLYAAEIRKRNNQRKPLKCYRDVIVFQKPAFSVDNFSGLELTVGISVE